MKTKLHSELCIISFLQDVSCINSNFGYGFQAVGVGADTCRGLPVMGPSGMEASTHPSAIVLSEAGA